MKVFNIMFVGILTITFTACGDEQSETVVSTLAKSTANAGVDKRIVINESISIKGSVTKIDNEVLSYEWKEKEETLATTETFIYTSTVLGTSVLHFEVQRSDGTFSIDNMNVIVTNKEINTSIPKVSEALKTEYLSAVNTARTQQQDCGSQGILAATGTVVWNEKLYSAAYEHAQDLIASQTFIHEGSGTESDWSGYVLSKKSSQVERVENYGYVWSRLGENLGGGVPIDTVEKAVQSWLESDSHCENLMNPSFKEVGMVMLTDENSLYTNYWGQNFGTAQ